MKPCESTEKSCDCMKKPCDCYEKKCNCMEESQYKCSYIDPMFDMTPMHYMGNMSTEYITMKTPYIMTCEEVDNINDMWNNYYMYIQKMIKSIN